MDIEDIDYIGKWIDDDEYIPTLHEVWELWASIGEHPEEYITTEDELYAKAMKRLNMDYVTLFDSLCIESVVMAVNPEYARDFREI